MTGRPVPLRTAILVSITLVLLALLLYGSVLHVENPDIWVSLRPWFVQIATRGFPALAGEYTVYTPPYLYLMAMADLLGDGLPDTVLIKAPSIVFNLAGAVLVGLIVRQTGRDVGWSLLAGSGFLLLPTVVLNSAYWGQCDIIYTSFLLAFLLASINRRPLLAVLCFGVALSFKLQTVFLGPYFLYLLLRREIPWRYIVLIPLVYAAAMMPAWLAGRPWKELLLVYVSQSHFYHRLSMNAPNLYALAERIGLSYEIGVSVGLIITAAAALAIPIYAQRLQVDDAEAKLVVATASALLMPFLLPKMHDRYFFAADGFTFVLACALPRFWWLATAMQASSVAAYLSFLFGVYRGPYVGALFSLIAVAGLVWALYQRLAPSGRVPHSDCCEGALVGDYRISARTEMGSRAAP